MVRIAVIPGDGIGPEVIREALNVLMTAAACGGKTIQTIDFDFGAERYLRDGVSLPSDALDRFRAEFDAILMGTLGDPRIPDNKHAIEILFGIRCGLDLYANIRPVKLLARRLTPLKNVTEADINFTVFRENTEDLYVGIGGIFKKGTADEVAIQESISTRKGVERILEAAFSFAATHRLKKVTMAASGNIRPEGPCMFEPVHGSAPRYAGRNVANPMGAIMSVQMMVGHLGWEAEASAIETAVQECVRAGECTEDLQGTLGTREVGAAVCRRLQKLVG
jgi:3-isopropylmalate dehydrogenase